MPPQPVARDDGRVARERQEAGEPDEGQVAAGTLRREIPRRVGERGDEDEAEGEGGHGGGKKSRPAKA